MPAAELNRPADEGFPLIFGLPDAHLDGSVQVTANKTLVSSKPEVLEAAQNVYSQVHAGIYPDFLDQRLLSALLPLSRAAPYERETVRSLGTRLVDTDDRAAVALRVCLRRPPLMQWLSEMSGCGPLAVVTGRFVEMAAGSGDALSWHKDGHRGIRRLAIVINFTEAPYEGGEFELRRAGAEDLLLRHKHEKLGSAVIFRVSDELEHRVLPVTSGGPRKVFAGWFATKELVRNRRFD